MDLDFVTFPRKRRAWSNHVTLYNGKNTTCGERVLTALLIHKWGWSNASLAYREHLRLACAASQLIMLDN